jgi:hypothetical protein
VKAVLCVFTGFSRDVEVLAEYMVSMPSGMMTTRAVPMRRPVPIAERRRVWRWVREKDSGSEPARKELYSSLLDSSYSYDHVVRD